MLNTAYLFDDLSSLLNEFDQALVNRINLLTTRLEALLRAGLQV